MQCRRVMCRAESMCSLSIDWSVFLIADEGCYNESCTVSCHLLPSYGRAFDMFGFSWNNYKTKVGGIFYGFAKKEGFRCYTCMLILM